MTRRQALVLLAAPPPDRAHSHRPFRRTSAWPGPGFEANGPFEIKVQGKPAKVVGWKDADSDLLLLVVFDLTGDLTLADAARQSLLAEIQKLPGNAWVGLLRAQDGLQVLLDPTPDRAAAEQAVSSLAINGRANLLDSLEPAALLASRLLAKTGVRTAVLCISDSNIYNYREDYTNPVINYSDSRDLSRRFPEALIREKTAKVAAVLAELDAPVFTAHVAFLRDRLNEAYQTGLNQIMQATGGEALFARAQTEIAGMIAAAMQKIRSMWAVDFEIPADTPKNFTIELSAGTAQLNYRSRFALRSRKRE